MLCHDLPKENQQEACGREMTIDTDYFSVKCRWISMIAAFAVIGLHLTIALSVADVVN